jgi:dTDP-4-amino-4,6-dideoxygalactose transaminase
MINVTKTFLPPFEEYTSQLKRAWDTAWITNNGELVQELEQRLRDYLGVKHVFFATNGTVVLQMAIKALNITGEVITTPFSYVATTNTIIWEGCKPVFVDINPLDCCIDVQKIEESITERTQAILATHVYGFPCNTEVIERIAEKYHLKVIYDGAHAFGCTYNGKALLDNGDISTCSFHATKLFHTVEGGCIVCNDDDLARRVMLMRQFGHIYDDYFSVGINGKNSEFHAAMGLAVFPHLPDIISARKELALLYDQTLDKNKTQILGSFQESQNYSYYPVLFASENQLLQVMKRLRENGVNTRRYFYPSLNVLPFLEYQPCPVSEDMSKRVLCLPLYFDLSHDNVRMISGLINDEVNNP